MNTPLSPQNQIHHSVARNRQTKTAIWTVLSVAVAFLAVLILSTIDTPSGDPWLESSLIVQTLATMGLILAAVLPSLLGTRKDAAVVREQVQNSHTKNQRDDMDDKHEEIRELLASKFEQLHNRMDDRFQAVASDIRGVRRDVGRLADGHVRLDKKIGDQGKVLDRLTRIEVNTETGEVHVIPPSDDN